MLGTGSPTEFPSNRQCCNEDGQGKCGFVAMDAMKPTTERLFVLLVAASPFLVYG